MNISSYIDPSKKKPWRRRVYDRRDGEMGPTYRIMTQEDFLDEVNSAAHAINSPQMSRRPIYGPTGEKDKNGKEKWAIVGYDSVETTPVGKQWEIISKKISHFAANGFWTSSESKDETAFKTMMSWADTAGMKTAFIEAMWHAMRTGDSAVYWYQTDDADDPIQYEVYGYEEGSVLFPKVDFDGRKSIARKYCFNKHDAVDIFTADTIETWMQLDPDGDDDIMPKDKRGELSDDGYTLVRRKDAQAGNICQCIYFRFEDIPTGPVQNIIEKLEDAKTYVGEHLKGSTMPILFMKTEKFSSLPPSKLANRAIGVKGATDSLAHSDAKWLAPPDASNIANLHIDGLEEDIRDTAMSVKISPDVIKQGSDSSATMKVLYAPEVQWAQIHWPEVFKSVKQMMLVFKSLVGKVEGEPKRYAQMRISVGQEIYIPQNAAETLKMELDQVYGRVKSRRSAMEDIGNAHMGDYEQIDLEWEKELTMKAEAPAKAKAKYGVEGDEDDEPKDNPGKVNNQAPGKSIQN